MAYIEMRDVKKQYHMGEVVIDALSGVTFQVEKGELCVVVGPSGAGKTTLLNILGGMDSATSGEVIVDGAHVEQYGKRELTLYRRSVVGFVFQFYNLVQNLTALENVELAAQICKEPLPAEQVLEQVGLRERMQNFPAQLSGGEQQRVSIARALAKNPQAHAVRRADRRARLSDGQAGAHALAGYLPQAGHDRHHHHAQRRAHAHGRPRDPREERHDLRAVSQRQARVHQRDRVVIWHAADAEGA